MKVMKFGGTSVGKPERMFQVRELISRDNEPTIVVLSALSGTTNTLVAIGDAMSAGDKVKADSLIDQLHVHYKQFLADLLKKEEVRTKAEKIIQEHFDFLCIILRISFNDALNKDILAQGELMSTKMFSCYLEEMGHSHLLLPALDFMSIDANDEPQVADIRSKLTKILDQHNGIQTFITQGYICRNAREKSTTSSEVEAITLHPL